MPSSLRHHLDPGRFFGQASANRALAGLALTETVYRPSLVIPRHDHELANFCIVLGGAYDERYGRRARHCLPGMLVLHPAGEHHADVHHAAPVRLLTVELSTARLEALCEFVPVLNEPAHFAGGEPAWLAERLAREFSCRDAPSNLALEALVLELLVTCQRSAQAQRDGPAPPWLARAEAYLHAHYAEPLGLEGVAAAAGVHPAHLARVFRRRHRCTLGAYQRRLRLDEARAQLACTERPLAEIAAVTGFADQSHFSRLFRAATGVTPAAYRRARRGR